MGTRVTVQHYNLRSANSYIGVGSSLHDLNTVDDTSRPGGGEMEGLSDVDRDVVPENSLENDDEESSAVDCIHESYRNSLPLHNLGLEEDRLSVENNGTSRGSYNILTIDDVSPIEAARARFLEIIVDHFIDSHVTEALESKDDNTALSSQEKPSKRKSREIYYVGDARFALPLMYVANMYETLVNEVNMRLSSLNGIREKTIGVALEAAGGLYRKLAKKFPRKGSFTFKRRELATSLETRTRFPELVIQEERRVRFVVVNGLDIVEKPTNIHVGDAEWFKRLTGRNEVAVSARDYKFYSPRRKYRRVASNSMPNIPGLPPQNQQQTPSKHHLQTLPNQPQFHPLHHHNCHPGIHQTQHTAQFSHCGPPPPPSHLPPEIVHSQQSPTISQDMTCLQPLSGTTPIGGGGRLHVLFQPTSPAKFCDECGAPYLRDTSKFCSECGVKRLGI